MLLLIAVYVLLVLVLPLGLGAAVSYRSLPRRRSCVLCGGDTLRLLSRPASAASRLIRSSTLERRWCPGCGWDGVVRVPPAEPCPATRTRTIDLRSLNVDGLGWLVRLQCWQQTGLSYGRLVFVAPSGRVWADGRPLRGASERELLGRALAMSDGLLVSRLRQLVSD